MAGADAASCPAALPSGWLPTPLKPPDVKVGSCTPEHISEYIAKCGQIDESPCAGFAASGDSAKQTCEACIWSDLTDATWGAAVTLESGSSNLNQAGCIVLDKGSSGGECGKSLWDQMHCSTRACSACPESKDCYTDAKLGVCKGYFDQVKTLCQQVQTPCVLGVDGGLPVEYVIDVFCGKGVAGQDGGPDAAADAG